MKKTFLIFLISRIFLVLSLFFFKSIRDNASGKITGSENTHIINKILDLFVYYDTHNYIDIVQNGYENTKLTTFFPVYPLLIRFFTNFGLEPFIVGVILSNIFLFLSLLFLNKILIKKEIEEKTRNFILISIAFFPSSYFFSTVYTESFFFFLTTLSFWLWYQEKRKLAYLIGGIAAATRLVGAFIPLAFFIERLVQKKLDVKDIIFSFFSFLIFSIYPLYLFIEKGNPLLFLEQQVYYFRKQTFFFGTIWQDIVWFFQEKTILPNVTIIHFVLFIMAIIFLIKKSISKNKEHFSEVIFVFGVILLPLSSISLVHIHLASHGFIRYILPAFPLFIFWSQIIYKLKNSNSKAIYYIFILLWLYVYIIMHYWLSYQEFLA